MALLRSLINGWGTSHRLHVGVVGPCRFKCGAVDGDRLGHYRCCPALRALLLAHGGPGPPDFVAEALADDRARWHCFLASKSYDFLAHDPVATPGAAMRAAARFLDDAR